MDLSIYRRFYFAALLCSLAHSPAHAEVVSGSARILDGDTISLGSTLIRLHGIARQRTDKTAVVPVAKSTTVAHLQKTS